MYDLTPFCGDDSGRYHLSAPVKFGGYEWATDGVIAVRQPSNRQPPKTKRRAEELRVAWPCHVRLTLFDNWPDDGWHPFGELPEPDREICQLCNGTGFAGLCLACEGDGADTEGGWCKRCGGEGVIAGGDRPCDHCEKGVILTWPTLELEGGVLVGADYMARFARVFRSPEYRPRGEDQPVLLRAKGGVQGVLAPMLSRRSFVGYASWRRGGAHDNS